jgi:DAK2 domain fusion protein YloV
VDAGGYGLQVMLEGMLRTLEETGGEEVARRPVVAAQTALELPEEGWGYCTEFLIVGENLDVDVIRDRIAARGNSVLVVGEPELVKVHVHTDDPTSVLSLAGSYGRLEKLSVGDMSSQHRRILERAAPPAGPLPSKRPNGVGLVAVVSGAGLVEILRGLGADALVEGGQTMNPSTRDMLNAIEAQPYDEVILLPNNKNVVMAAREAVKASERKQVHLVETQTVPQGIAAVIAFNGERAAAANIAAMNEAAGRVQTIEVTHAVRDTRSNGVTVKKGDVIALVNDKLETAGADYGSVVASALEHIGLEAYELVTVYTGEGATEGDAERVSTAIRDQFPQLEVEVQAGGPDHYPFILSVE